jgi:hypothetical protein
MDSAFMLKRVVLGGLMASVVAACSTGAPSEQIVQSNLPAAERAAAPDAPTSNGAPPSKVDAPSNGKKAITSQEVEKELNRLEAELR